MVFKDVMVCFWLPEDHFLGELKVLGLLGISGYRLIHLAESDVPRLARLGVGISHVQMPCIDRSLPSGENIN